MNINLFYQDQYRDIALKVKVAPEAEHKVVRMNDPIPDSSDVSIIILRGRSHRKTSHKGERHEPI